jgi:hypothetical protein
MLSDLPMKVIFNLYMDRMKVKYINETCVSLTNGKIYEVIAVEEGLFRIVDDTDEDYLFYPEEFEIVEK